MSGGSTEEHDDMYFDPDLGPEHENVLPPEIHIPPRFVSAEAFLASIGATEKTEFGGPMYLDVSGVLVNLKQVNWAEVRRLRGEPEPTGIVSTIAKHAKRISGGFFGL